MSQRFPGENGEVKANRIMLGAMGILFDSTRTEVKNCEHHEQGPWYSHSEDTSDLSTSLINNLNMSKKLPTPFYNSNLYKSEDRESVLKLCDYYDPLCKFSTMFLSKKVINIDIRAH